MATNKYTNIPAPRVDDEASVYETVKAIRNLLLELGIPGAASKAEALGIVPKATGGQYLGPVTLPHLTLTEEAPTVPVPNSLYKDFFGLTIPYIQLDIEYANGSVEGRLQWNMEDGTLEYGLPGGNVTLQVGQEMVVKCVNKTGVTISDGEVVYISGASGSRPEISLADASDPAKDMPIGMATEDITNSNQGYVNVGGLVRGIDTSGITAGSPGYLSEATPGAFRATAPGGLNAEVVVGYCIVSSAGSGIFFVKVHNHFSQHLLLDGSRAMTGNLDMGTKAITNVGNVDGRDVSADGSKLDGIESGATQDQTAAEILTALKTVDGAGSGLDSDLLDSIDSVRFVFGDNLRGTTNVADFDAILKSGFYNGNGATGAPTGGTWYLVTHNQYHGTDSYAFQIAHHFFSSAVYLRRKNAGVWGAWTKLWHAGNDGTGSGLDADLLDGSEGSVYANNMSDADATELTDGSTTTLHSHAGGTGAWVALESKAPSGVANADFLTGMDSTYDLYVLSIRGLTPATDNRLVFLRVSIDGSTFVSGASSYAWGMHYINTGGGSVINNDSADSEITIVSTSANAAVGSASNESYSGEIYIYRPSDTALWTLFGFNSNWMIPAGSDAANANGSALYQATNAVVGIQVLMSSGSNFSADDITLYGVAGA